MAHARLFPIPLEGNKNTINTPRHASPAVTETTTPVHPGTSSEAYVQLFQRVSENLDPRADQMFDLDCEEIGNYLKNRH